MRIETKQQKKERLQAEAAVAWRDHLARHDAIDQNMRRLRQERLVRHREVTRTLQALKAH